MKLITACVILGSFLIQAECAPKERPKIWAVLVAGSNYYNNYRHQADVCHAYQIIHSHGIPDERIIVMMYDDIARNKMNPNPGVITNYPNGKDVYHGVPKDYTGDAVTAKNLMKILRGENMTGIGSGKTLKSGPNDHVFVYYADHGASGLICMPTGDEFTVKDLNQTITYMHQNKKYGKMVWYIEACHSGSMFNGVLSPNINVYGTTAANPNEESYGCYLSKKDHTYLGDRYSVVWMQNSDESNLYDQDLGSQYKWVKDRTPRSHVCEYGDMKMKSMHLANFQGWHHQKAVNEQFSHLSSTPTDSVSQYDIPMVTLKKRLEAAKTEEEAEKIQTEIQALEQKQKHIKWLFETLVGSIVGNDDELSHRVWSTKIDVITKLDCHDRAVKAFGRHCNKIQKDESALRLMHVFVNMCEEGIQDSKIQQAIETTCVFQ